MALQESSLLLKINFVILVLAVLVDILGLSLPFWIYDVSGTAHYGLWQICPAAGYCYGLSFSTSWLAAVQSFAIIGCIVLLVALILTIAAVFCTDKRVIKLIAWILCFFAAACIIVEFVVFVCFTTTGYYSGAFALTIIACILALACGIIGFIDWLGKGP